MCVSSRPSEPDAGAFRLINVSEFMAAATGNRRDKDVDSTLHFAQPEKGIGRGEISLKTFEVGDDCSQSVLNCLDRCYRHPLFFRRLPC